MLRKLFCKHNYLWTAEITITTTNADGNPTSSYRGKEIYCECMKCGKKKIFRFDKMIKERGYNYDDV